MSGNQLVCNQGGKLLLALSYSLARILGIVLLLMVKRLLTGDMKAPNTIFITLYTVERRLSEIDIFCLKFSIAVKDLQFYLFILSIVANKEIYISVRAIDKKSQALISYHQPEHIRCINLKSGPVQRVV
uniref:Uncharacterized protein n=1 Tax=Glossina palpalis gambiensis TaxID=67801 RepID=A0A1B0AQ58_9MUSC